jgi:hypothetical protein
MGADQRIPKHRLQTDTGNRKPRPDNQSHDDPRQPDFKNNVGGHFILRLKPQKQPEQVTRMYPVAAYAKSQHYCGEYRENKQPNSGRFLDDCIVKHN